MIFLSLLLFEDEIDSDEPFITATDHPAFYFSSIKVNV